MIHNRSDKVPPQRTQVAFGKGFDIARRSLFKLLREELPEDWNELAIAGC